MNTARVAMTDWGRAVRVYGDRRVVAMWFLGIASGLPFGILAEPFSAWLTEGGMSKTGIGLFALVSLPYALKVLWAPFIDRLSLPLLTARLGRRRGWGLLAQAVLIAAIVALGETEPGTAVLWTAFFAAAVAFASASQDVVIDAYRVEILEERQLAAGAAMAVFGWRIGQFGAAAAGLVLADWLPWPAVFAILGGFVAIGMITLLMSPEPRAPSLAQRTAEEDRARAFVHRQARLPRPVVDALAWIYGAAICPLVEFAGRRDWMVILLFILLYKFGDAVLAIMKVPFFLEIGFTKTEIAEIAKVFGGAATITGGLIGGVLLARIGIYPGLFLCGALMAGSNLVFVLQAMAGADLSVLAFTVACENLTTGMGTAAFVAYLSSLCNVAYTATQYALLSSLMALSRTVLSSAAGWLADQLPWTLFFVVTTLAAVPGLLLLLWLWRRPPAIAPKVADGAETVGTAAGS